MAIDNDKKNTIENDCGDEKDPNKTLSSNDVQNAHAAGDGAVGRSKEAISEEDILPQKEERNTKDEAAY